MAVETRIELEPDKRHYINFTELTALFVEVLELYQLTFRLYESSDAGADTGMDSEETCWRYRRRWFEITGIEVPE